MQTLHSRAGVAPGYSRVFLISLLSSVSLSAAAIAQSVDRDKPPVEIGPVTVSPSTPRTAPAISPGNQKPRTARRATGRRPTAPIAARPTNPPAGDTTPLNTAAVAGVSSRLGISARETPATVEVISQQTMSRLPERAREKLCRALALTKYTETTIVDVDSLMKVLDETRKRGWAKTNEEYVRGVVGCAVPILSPDRELIACLGVSVPVARVSFVELDRFIAPLQKAAALLSETILQADEDGASDPS